jgi:hypothetical protein
MLRAQHFFQVAAGVLGEQTANPTYKKAGWVIVLAPYLIDIKKVGSIFECAYGTICRAFGRYLARCSLLSGRRKWFG